LVKDTERGTGSNMVKPVRNAYSQCTALELKTMKVSQDTINNIRKPLVWERPSASLYDYHYEIGGLYYQPMISYCQERDEGSERRTVQIPDRILANYDKRNYTFKNEECDYDGFLTNCYQRKLKANHSKTIHCANERIKGSKKTTDLGKLTNAATDRDKYLCQIQLMYTAKLAQEERERQEKEGREGEVDMDMGETEVVVTRRNEDDRYGPGYRKADHQSRRFHGARPENPLVVLGLERGSDMAVQSKKEKAVEFVEYKGVNKEYLEAKKLKDFINLSVQENMEKESREERPYKPLYVDTSYSKAIADVKTQLKTIPIGEKKLAIDDIKLNYGNIPQKNIRSSTKAAVRTEMFKIGSVPNFDVGYETVG
jgi:hypothetical protein